MNSPLTDGLTLTGTPSRHPPCTQHAPSLSRPCHTLESRVCTSSPFRLTRTWWRYAGVLLNQAIIQLALAHLTTKGYTPLQTPFFMKREAMAQCAQVTHPPSCCTVQRQTDTYRNHTRHCACVYG